MTLLIGVFIYRGTTLTTNYHASEGEKLNTHKASIVQTGLGVLEFTRAVSYSGPIFGDGSFKFVPVPENYPSNSSWTYEELGLSEWLPEDWVYAHYDPEFVTYTWGSFKNDRSLYTRQLSKGDFVFFIASLTYDRSRKVTREPWVSDYGLYVVGFFELEEIPQEADILYPIRPEIKRRYSNNAHVRRDPTKGDLVPFLIFKGTEHSRLLDVAIPFSDGLKPNKLACKAIPNVNPERQKWWSDTLITKEGIDTIFSEISLRNRV